ncbi:MAG: zinc ABC transporter substrate-binding protein [Candidatus Methanoperedenaceae archaeon]|nr:zinc ABC transporter substrate-binding protein [Candidatus Methanoperedenaceae archaeon]
MILAAAVRQVDEMNLMKHVFTLILLIILLVIFTGCVEVPQTEKEINKRIGVVVSILPQAEFVEKVGGDKVQVVVMVPPEASPHTYEPTPSQLKEVSKAKMYAKVGSGVEFELAWMDKIISVNKGMLVIDCSKRMELIEGEHDGEPHEHKEEHEHHGVDPHIWLSPKNAKIMVENIYQGLIQIDPANQEYYARNKEKYLQELDELDNEITQALSGKKNRKIMVYHPAWAYFARDYGLEQIPIEGEGKEPTPQGIANLIKQAKENNITVIFASLQFSTKSAEVVAKEIDGEVVLISPLEKSYLENMRKVAEAFAKV